MKRKFTYLKKFRKILIFILSGFFLIVCGCYTIVYIIQPDVVAPNSAFNVKIAVIQENGNDLSDFSPGYGFVGILLPEGWHVKDSLDYWETNGLHQKGIYCFNNSVVSFLYSHYGKQAGYYWWGAKSLNMIDIAYLDTGYINVTIITNENPGPFRMGYVLGDDNDWHKSGPQVPYGIVQERYLPINVVTTQAHKTSKNDEWEVYPNPSSGRIKISVGSLQDKTAIKVYDANGRLQKSGILNDFVNDIDLSDLSKGIYTISLEKRGEIKTKKVIIQ